MVIHSACIGVNSNSLGTSLVGVPQTQSTNSTGRHGPHTVHRVLFTDWADSGRSNQGTGYANICHCRCVRHVILFVHNCPRCKQAARVDNIDTSSTRFWRPLSNVMITWCTATGHLWSTELSWQGNVWTLLQTVPSDIGASSTQEDLRQQPWAAHATEERLGINWFQVLVLNRRTEYVVPANDIWKDPNEVDQCD
jgi:hypothetical protein